MADVYFSRAGAATAAHRRGVTAFETYQPVPKADPNAWCYTERDPGPGIDYAMAYAADKDWIHHTEITERKVPVLVVTITKAELPADIPKLFEVRPITPSLWDKQEPWKGPRHIATGVPAAANVPAPPPKAAAPRAPKGEGPVAVVWSTCNEMPGASRKEVIAACVAKGINPSTASVQYGAWKKSQN